MASVGKGWVGEMGEMGERDMGNYTVLVYFIGAKISWPKCAIISAWFKNLIE